MWILVVIAISGSASTEYRYAMPDEATCVTAIGRLDRKLAGVGNAITATR